MVILSNTKHNHNKYYYIFPTSIHGYSVAYYGAIGTAGTTCLYKNKEIPTVIKRRLSHGYEPVFDSMVFPVDNVPIPKIGDIVFSYRYEKYCIVSGYQVTGYSVLGIGFISCDYIPLSFRIVNVHTSNQFHDYFAPSSFTVADIPVTVLMGHMYLQELTSELYKQWNLITK